MNRREIDQLVSKVNLSVTDLLAYTAGTGLMLGLFLGITLLGYTSGLVWYHWAFFLLTLVLCGLPLRISWRSYTAALKALADKAKWGGLI